MECNNIAEERLWISRDSMADRTRARSPQGKTAKLQVRDSENIGKDGKRGSVQSNLTRFSCSLRAGRPGPRGSSSILNLRDPYVSGA